VATASCFVRFDPHALVPQITFEPPHGIFGLEREAHSGEVDKINAVPSSAGIRCWIAPRDVPAGMNWPSAILDSISQSRLMVLIFSSHAIESKDVQREVAHAFRNDVIVIPLRIENVQPSGDMAYFISTTHWLDAMTSPLESHLHRLCQNVAALLPTLQGDGKALPVSRLSGVANEEPQSVAVGVPRPLLPAGMTSQLVQWPAARKLAPFAIAAMAALVLIGILVLIKSASTSASANPQNSSSGLGDRPAPSVGQRGPLPRPPDEPTPSSKTQEASAPGPPAGWVVKPVIDPDTRKQRTIGKGLKVFEAYDPTDSSRKMFFGSKSESNPTLDVILGKQY
jgi:hypothetical protein